MTRAPAHLPFVPGATGLVRWPPWPCATPRVSRHAPGPAGAGADRTARTMRSARSDRARGSFTRPPRSPAPQTTGSAAMSEGSAADPAARPEPVPGQAGRVIRVLVAEDMRILRDTLVAVLNLEDDMEVVAEVTDGEAIVPAAADQRPDVAVVDIDLPGTDGLTAAARLHEQFPGCKVLILTVLGGPGNLRRALAAHVAGFLPKDTPAAELVDAIRKVAAGERVIDPQLALKALEVPDSPLSPREAEVLRRFAAGAGPAEIAAALFLSYGTVRNYLASAVTKLGARNRVDAVRIAAEAGWL